MSSNNNNVLSCKVCMDANKPKSVYSTHRVKHNGVVVCPTLLSQECKYCHKKGHTVKFCSTLKKENERKEKQLADGSADKKKTQRVEFKDPISTTNRFRVLEEQEDWNETVCIIAPALCEVPHVKDVYPALTKASTVIAPTVIAPILGGYAAALKSAAPLKTQLQTKTPTLPNIKTQTETHKKLFGTYDPTQKKSWSNCPDSDDEEEEEKMTGTCAW
jgi:hypothetical protein